MYLESEKTIDQLKDENDQLRLRCSVVEQNMKTIIDKLPIAALVTDANLQALFFNKLASDLLSSPTETGIIIPEYLKKLLYIAKLDGHIVGKIIECQERKYSISIYDLTNKESFLVIIRNIYQDNVAKEEIEARVREALDLRMGLVQKIGFLLGEEASEISKKLNSVMEILENTHEKL